ncbi:hepcidin [Mus pahari]|uniref:hepcidin n=1 Tax=Mus pahari TaxID=10093 RepID=UPI000A3075DE|nr:hepcidin [Mus pahari]
MALSTRTQAACLLLLLLASLSSTSYLQHQMRQTTGLKPLHREESRADSVLLMQKRRKRDTNFPICIFCCRCCNNPFCGFCCKT